MELLTTRQLFGPVTFGGLESLHDDPVGLTLSRLGERAVEALVPVLTNPSHEVRMRTITILFAMPESSAHEALIRALHTESDPQNKAVYTRQTRFFHGACSHDKLTCVGREERHNGRGLPAGVPPRQAQLSGVKKPYPSAQSVAVP